LMVVSKAHSVKALGMRPEDQSELLLRVELPSALPGEIRYRDGQERSWSAPRQGAEGLLTAAALWQALLDHESDSDPQLEAAGRILGAWLLDPKALEVLQSFHGSWKHTGRPRGRIEIWGTEKLAPYPWEATWLAGFASPLGTLNSFTFVRRLAPHNRVPTHSSPTISIDLVGVKLDHSTTYAALTANTSGFAWIPKAVGTNSGSTCGGTARLTFSTLGGTGCWRVQDWSFVAHVEPTKRSPRPGCARGSWTTRLAGLPAWSF
jgi:hypothetical protein